MKRLGLVAWLVLLISVVFAPPLGAFQEIEAPRGVSGSSVSGGARITWNLVDGAEGYNLYRDNVYVATVDGPPAIDDVSGTHRYYVTAFGGGQFSSRSNEITVTVAAQVATVSAPSNLRASTSGSNVVLSWSAPANAAGYNVYRNNQYVTTVTGTSWTGAAGNHTYYVTAFDASKSVFSSRSNQIRTSAPAPTTTRPAPTTTTRPVPVTAAPTTTRPALTTLPAPTTTTRPVPVTAAPTTTRPAPTTTVPTTTRPAPTTAAPAAPLAPSVVWVVDNGSGQSTLRWAAVPAAGGYNVYRNGQYVTTQFGTSWTDSIAPDSHSYYVTTFDEGRNAHSVRSQTVTGLPAPEAPETFNAPVAPTASEASVGAPSAAVEFDSAPLFPVYQSDIGNPAGDGEGGDEDLSAPPRDPGDTLIESSEDVVIRDPEEDDNSSNGDYEGNDDDDGGGDDVSVPPGDPVFPIDPFVGGGGAVFIPDPDEDSETSSDDDVDPDDGDPAVPVPPVEPVVDADDVIIRDPEEEDDLFPVQDDDDDDDPFVPVPPVGPIDPIDPVIDAGDVIIRDPEEDDELVPVGEPDDDDDPFVPVRPVGPIVPVDPVVDTDDAAIRDPEEDEGLFPVEDDDPDGGDPQHSDIPPVDLVPSESDLPSSDLIPDSENPALTTAGQISSSQESAGVGADAGVISGSIGTSTTVTEQSVPHADGTTTVSQEQMITFTGSAGVGGVVVEGEVEAGAADVYILENTGSTEDMQDGELFDTSDVANIPINTEVIEVGSEGVVLSDIGSTTTVSGAIGPSAGVDLPADLEGSVAVQPISGSLTETIHDDVPTVTFNNDGETITTGIGETDIETYELSVETNGVDVSISRPGAEVGIEVGQTTTYTFSETATQTTQVQGQNIPEDLANSQEMIDSGDIVLPDDGLYDDVTIVTNTFTETTTTGGQLTGEVGDVGSGVSQGNTTLVNIESTQETTVNHMQGVGGQAPDPNFPLDIFDLIPSDEELATSNELTITESVDDGLPGFAVSNESNNRPPLASTLETTTASTTNGVSIEVTDAEAQALAQEASQNFPDNEILENVASGEMTLAEAIDHDANNGFELITFGHDNANSVEAIEAMAAVQAAQEQEEPAQPNSHTSFHDENSGSTSDAGHNDDDDDDDDYSDDDGDFDDDYDADHYSSDDDDDDDDDDQDSGGSGGGGGGFVDTVTDFFGGLFS